MLLFFLQWKHSRNSHDSVTVIQTQPELYIKARFRLLSMYELRITSLFIGVSIRECKMPYTFHMIHHLWHNFFTFFSLASLSSSQRHSPCSRDGESMLLNVAGKLMVFQRDRSGPQILEKEKSSPHKHKPVSLEGGCNKVLSAIE